MPSFLRMALAIAAVLLFPSVFTSAVESSNETAECRNPIVRKEWYVSFPSLLFVPVNLQTDLFTPRRTLSKPQKLQYLSAVQCALRKPSITPPTAAPGALSRYDDLVATHINQTMSIHFVGHFLPWHRLFTAYYEKLLREECGYRGAQPYWDWTLDSTPAKFLGSPVFDPVYGFGGNGPLTTPYNASANEVPGRTGGGCVADGPFTNMTVHLGPFTSLSRNDQCLKRDFAPEYAVKYLAREKLDEVLAQAEYGWFARTLEGGTSFDESQIHAGGQ
jgi:tyrosinase